MAPDVTYSTHAVEALAPRGKLRATVNLGNPVLAHQLPGQPPGGVSVDLARTLANRLGVPLELVVFDGAGKAVQCLESDEADIGFFAIDPLRANSIAFTAPYILIEGCYLVRDASPLHGNDQVDRAGTRVAVGKGSAYHLFLSRELLHADIVRIPTSPAVVAAFIEGGHDVAAGVRQQLEADAQRHGGLRLLPGRFMVIEQAMAVPKSRGALAASLLKSFVEDMKSSGLVLEALRRHGVEGASVAPPAA
ncbi:MAG: ABC transporter substrate-binding protein [Burkholderiales bacterium]|nr:ABC transporter substrate-binding protein [Burkholderiales bacterium]MBS0403209.1 ABC transporter substrate-binding protein [Pseudomonadota bacterium]